MNIVQKQCLLKYLGYYHGTVDGIWGKKSSAATRFFQEAFGGVSVDGICGEETEKALKHAVAYGMPVKENGDWQTGASEFWDEVEYFTREEFKCKCGGKYCNGYPYEPDPTMVRYAHNANVGGATKSQHLLGKACDLSAPDGFSPREMALIAEDVIGNTGGIGVYPWGIHIDSRSVKARWNG